MVREGRFDLKKENTTSGCVSGFVQANLLILPDAHAEDFRKFCDMNPKPCPVLAVLNSGERVFGNDIDVASDVPKYRVFYEGKPHSTVENLSDIWRSDLCTFVIGCSFSFEEALIEAGIPLRHIDAGKNVPMFKSNIACVPSPTGKFKGDMVVSMRSMSPENAELAKQITAKYPRVHGSPIHIGDPATIGIADISKPDYGDSVDLHEGDVCVFWACGVTPQRVAIAAGAAIDMCVTHEPGFMLVMDEKNQDLASS